MRNRGATQRERPNLIWLPAGSPVSQSFQESRLLVGSEEFRIDLQEPEAPLHLFLNQRDKGGSANNVGHTMSMKIPMIPLDMESSPQKWDKEGIYISNKTFPIKVTF